MPHGMFGWELPPGVSVNDIPGNRPEDGEWEAICEKFFDKERLLASRQITEKQHDDMDRLYRESEFAPLVDDYIRAAIQYGLDSGEKQASEAWQQERRYENENIFEVLKTARAALHNRKGYTTTDRAQKAVGEIDKLLEDLEGK